MAWIRWTVFGDTCYATPAAVQVTLLNAAEVLEQDGESSGILQVFEIVGGRVFGNLRAQRVVCFQLKHLR